MAIFILMCTVMHMLPADVLGLLGIVSDHVSDISPEFMRGVEHVVFTLMLN